MTLAYFQTLVSAMVATGLIVAVARLLLSFVLPEPQNYIPALCVGVGFLIGHYSPIGSLDGPATVAMIPQFLGSALGLIILAAGFRYRARRTDVV